MTIPASDLKKDALGTLVKKLNQGGGGGGTDATSIQTVPVDPTLPTVDQVLVYDGSSYVPMQLTQDMILPAFAISGFSTASSIVEVGQSVPTPAFTASYSLPPDAVPNSVVLTDNAGTPAKDVTLTPLGFSSNGTFVQNVYGGSYTFTLTAKRGTNTKVATTSVTWTQKVFWGVSVVPGAYNEAFIEGLASNALATSRARTISVNAGLGQKIYYAYRNAYGDATFTVGGFSGGFTKVAASVPVTNINGFTENYEVWESDNPNLGATTVVVT